MIQVWEPVITGKTTPKAHILWVNNKDGQLLLAALGEYCKNHPRSKKARELNNQLELDLAVY